MGARSPAGRESTLRLRNSWRRRQPPHLRPRSRGIQAAKGSHRWARRLGVKEPCGGCPPKPARHTVTAGLISGNSTCSKAMAVAGGRHLQSPSDVRVHTRVDATAGLVIAPRPRCEADLDTRTFTRRLPILELRAKGLRTRMVDHATESLL